MVHKMNLNNEHNEAHTPRALARKITLFNQIDFNLVKNRLERHGVLLNGYREEFLIRRVSYHFNRSDVESTEEYFLRLTKDPAFLNDLLDSLTVNLSYFFRDKESFEYLKKDIFPQLFHKFKKVRIWSMGCSIGAEIYSVALILHAMGLLDRSELIATDNDQGVLHRAQLGKYCPTELKNLPKEYDKYFLKTDENYNRQKMLLIDPSIKSNVYFQRHDLTSGKPLAKKGLRKFQLLICRNVMIYFSKEAKENLYSQFYDWLEPGGILFIGANELLMGPVKYKFETLRSQFYRKPENPIG